MFPLFVVRDHPMGRQEGVFPVLRKWLLKPVSERFLLVWRPNAKRRSTLCATSKCSIAIKTVLIGTISIITFNKGVGKSWIPCFHDKTDTLCFTTYTVYVHASLSNTSSKIIIQYITCSFKSLATYRRNRETYLLYKYARTLLGVFFVLTQKV